MAVTLLEVEKISKLAKLRFDDEQKIKLQKDMNKILDYVEKINELNLSKVEPAGNINETYNLFRKDEIKQNLKQEEIFKNTITKSPPFFKVPKVIKK